MTEGTSNLIAIKIEPTEINIESIQTFCDIEHNDSTRPTTEISQTKRNQNNATTSTTALNDTAGQQDIIITSDRQNVNIAKSNNQPGVRSWDKQHACLFCTKLYTKLPRHLESKHFDEPDVARFLILPKNSKERKDGIEKIRQLGNYTHNAKILNTGHGDIIPKKRSRKSRHIKDMTLCKNCYGLYAKKDIYLHYKKCYDRTKPRTSKKCSTIFQTDQEGTEEFQGEILSNMRQDAIFQQIRQDVTLLKFGSNLYNQHKKHPHLKTYVSQRMRQLGRLLLEVKEKNPSINNLAEMVHPENFDYFISAVKFIAGHNMDNTYQIPSLALRLRSSIQQYANLLKSDSTKHLMFDRRKEIEGFIDLIATNFTSQVSTHALNTVYTNKWNKTTVLPMAKDLKTLTDYLKDTAKNLMLDININPTAENWSDLCDISLVQTLIFNRRRAGEVEQVFVDTFKNRDTTPPSEEILKSLNEVEKHLAKTLTMFETRGKRGRKVTILLTTEIKNQIDFLCDFRENVNIPAENLYLFANPKTYGFKRSGQLLKKYAKLCKTENSDAITSTKLRKYVATACQLLNLEDNEMDQFATGMGHDIRVHREYYRLPDSSVQVSKVSKLLLTLEKGNLLKNKGKNFVNMDLNATSDSEEDSSDAGTMTRNNMNIVPKENIPISSRPRSQIMKKKFNTKEDKSDIENQEIIINKKLPKTKITTVTSKKSTKKTPVKQTIKKEWSSTEKDAIQREMGIYWIRKKVPNKKECEQCLQNEPDLRNRTWKQIKYYVHNIIQKNNKRK